MLSLRDARTHFDDNCRPTRKNSALDAAAEKAKLRLLLCDDS